MIDHASSDRVYIEEYFFAIIKSESTLLLKENTIYDNELKEKH